MAKTQTQYVCQRCGRITAAYVGKCPQCHEFGTMVEQLVAVDKSEKRGGRPISTVSKPERLAEISSDGFARLAVPIGEFSRVLGGGIVPGSIILVGGEPGIGKSTLLLQVAALSATQHGPSLYISGEESVRQIKMRADRMKVSANDLFLVTETNSEVMFQHIAEVKPGMVIVDSIQTTYTGDLNSSAGSVSASASRAGSAPRSSSMPRQASTMLSGTCKSRPAARSATRSRMTSWAKRCAASQRAKGSVSWAMRMANSSGV